jgi:predicted HicB family RNase H-like nuclease
VVVINGDLPIWRSIKMTKQELLIHRIDQQLKQKAQEKAKEDCRSLSSWIKKLIVEAVK